MSDVHCAVCAEPWDAYGVRHGDMKKWEAALFKQGAGCPSCEGAPVEGVDPDDAAYQQALDLGIRGADDDPCAWRNGVGPMPSETRPKWVAPEPPAPVVHWTCDGCGVQCRTVVDTDTDEKLLEWHIPREAKASQWYHSHPFRFREPDESDREPNVVIRDGDDETSEILLRGCKHCACFCDECETDLLGNVDYSDTYDAGQPFYVEGDYRGDKPLCIDCFEKLCSDCECNPCTCESESDSESDEDEDDADEA